MHDDLISYDRFSAGPALQPAFDFDFSNLLLQTQQHERLSGEVNIDVERTEVKVAFIVLPQYDASQLP